MASGFELGCDGPTTLVVGVDGSDTATRALYYALGLARRQRCRVIAVHAITTLAGYDGTMGAAPYQAGLELADELRPAIEALAADYHVPVQFVSVAGDPVTMLVKIAAARHADGIVLGASKAISHRLFGSTAVRAVRRCRCPVTVVP
ncbi:MAG TPA: universal stress protein [Streptosporangiaceae bacterium]|jgi:nucleotide-binding universal stress UspA family protein